MSFDPETPTVVFDLGGVLVDWNPRYLYRRIFDDEREMEWFLREVCSPAWNLCQDEGRPFAEAVAEKQRQYPEYAAAIAAYHEHWPEMLGGAIPGSLDVLRAVRATGRPFYALTNWSHETFPHARRQYDFLGWFHGIVVSGEEGLVKPDPAIYRLLLERYGLDPEKTVFVDDMPYNVDAARRVGMRGLQFTGADRLWEDLRRLGVIPRQRGKGG